MIAMLYHHTQRGRLLPILAVVGALVIAGVLAAAHQPLVILTLLPILGIVGVFSTMTIELDETELRHHFGLGVWHKRVPLSEVVDATRTTSYWLEGWGIRITMRGMLYNVAGTDAVEIRLRSGRRFRLGTDEPDVLLAALRQAGVPTGMTSGA
jgi:hypothetical protein